MPEPVRRPAPSDLPGGGLTLEEDTRWAAFAHLGGLLGIVPALVVFIVLGRRGPKTRLESKEALNWQVTLLIALVVVDIVAAILTGLVILISNWTGHPAAYPGALAPGIVSGVVWLPNVALSILAFLRVRGGGSYRYPFAVRFIK